MAKQSIIDYALQSQDGAATFIGQSAKTGNTYKLDKVLLRLSIAAAAEIVDDLITALEMIADHPDASFEIVLDGAGSTDELVDTFAKYCPVYPFSDAARAQEPLRGS